ncbi:hypothetical protein BIV57_11965 [Mangrovactinospora gilvigrisea]|uniref:Zinc-finger domain-containing protein n=1 Tax=Mangrovactinospora gilvigrisea TaxID=1428644 RepID=A0A1J7BF78_9ACTN|nr:hypothetical protein [Mangrovactinospora gilvigrisea]OIV37229.1 hypothetical protein BIV57_11965 [Mangrovactinospora gilvigrisea]
MTHAQPFPDPTHPTLEDLSLLATHAAAVDTDEQPPTAAAPERSGADGDAGVRVPGPAGTADDAAQQSDASESTVRDGEADGGLPAPRDEAEGLSGAQVAALRAHLEGCAECAAAHQELTALPAVLRGLGKSTAEPMPDDVFARLTEALTAEADARTAATAAAPPVSRETGARRTAPPTRDDATRPPARRAPARAPRRKRWLARAVLATAALAVVAGGAVAVVRTLAPSHNDLSAGSGAKSNTGSASAPHHGPVYTDAGLTDQVHRLVQGSTRHSTTQQQPESAPSPNSARPTTSCAPPQAPGQTQAKAAPLASGPGTYQGRAVTVLVYPDGPTRLRVYLLPDPCTSAAAHPLLVRSIPR